MIREVLLDVGDGQGTLDSTLRMVDWPDIDGPRGGFAHVIITPVRLRADYLTPATAFAHSMYTGLIRGIEHDSADGRTTVRFASPLAWSGDEDSKGDNPIDTSGGGPITARPFWNGIGNTSVVEAWRTRSQGLTVHASVPTAATPAVSYSVDEGATGLDILRGGARGAFPTWYEFFLDPQLALHADIATNLFRGGHAVVQPWLDGPVEGGRWAIPALPADDGDVEDYTTRVRVNNGPSISGEAAWPTGRYRTIAGADVEWQRTIQSNAPANNLAAFRVADTQLRRFGPGPRHAISIGTTSPLVRLHVQPGDWVHCYVPSIGVYDTANPSYVGGRVMALVTGLRCQAIRWGVTRPMGKYMVWHDGTGLRIVDWSSHWIPESPGAELEIGALTRTFAYEPLAPAQT